MKPPKEPQRDKDEPPPKPTRTEEALRIIEEYANDLREIIKKLRGPQKIESMQHRPHDS